MRPEGWLKNLSCLLRSLLHRRDLVGQGSATRTKPQSASTQQQALVNRATV